VGSATRNQVQSIQVWESKIDYEGIVNTLQGHCFASLCCTGCIHLISGLHQRALQEVLDRYVVFYH
jgi:hypothetical protein